MNEPTHEAHENSVNEVQLEAPPYLEPGQNIFDQPPFNTLTDISSQRSNIPVEHLRKILRSIACSLSRWNEYNSRLPQKELETLKDRSDVEAISRTLHTLGVKDKSVRDKYKQVAGAMKAALKPWPGWQAYIRLMLEKEVEYNDTGAYMVKNAQEGLLPEQTAPSYANWIVHEQNAESRTKLTGLEESLPSIETSATVSSNAEKPIRRRYSILLNSDLITRKTSTTKVKS
jgi:hypothetical protein